MANSPTSPMAMASGAFTPSATTAPSTITERAMPSSTSGIATPSIASVPPAAMARTKVAGTSHSARPPSCQAKIPTVTMARTWSSPPSGCARPCTKPCASPIPGWARAAVGTSVRAMAAVRRWRMVGPRERQVRSSAQNRISRPRSARACAPPSRRAARMAVPTPRGAGSAGEGLRRHHDNAAVAHAALGDHVLGEVLHRAGLALEHGHLHAAVVVEVDVERGQRQLVVVVERLGQAFGQLAGGVIVDVDHGRHAVALGVERFRRLADAGAGEVADGLGAILVAPGRDDAIELGHELVVDGDGHALHGTTAGT